MCNFSSSPNPVVAAVSERIDMTRIENFCIILLNIWYTDLCISVFRIRKIEMQFIIIIPCKHLSLCVVGIKKPEWTLSSSFAEHRNLLRLFTRTTLSRAHTSPRPLIPRAQLLPLNERRVEHVQAYGMLRRYPARLTVTI